MKNKGILVIIDAQYDFCDPKGTLYVPGATADMERLIRFIKKHRTDIGEIILSQDMHQVVDISHPIFWLDNYGNCPKPFTEITAKEVENKQWIPRFEEGYVLNYLKQLEQQAEYPHIIWPEHCIAGTQGASIVPELMDEIKLWARQGRFFTMIHKGQNPFTEHFGIIRANIPIPDDITTQENQLVLEKLSSFETIWIAGEAKSHCVANTIKQLLPYSGLIKRLVLLEDCMSAVRGFEHMADPIFEMAKKKGARFNKSSDI